MCTAGFLWISSKVAMAMTVSKRYCLLISAILTILLALVLVHQLSQTDSYSPKDLPEYSVRHTYNPAELSSELAQVRINVRQCFNYSHIAVESSDLLSLAMDNAELFMEEYRKVIPKQSLNGYFSHCWPVSYSATAANWFTGRVIGQINGFPFDRNTDSWFYGKNQYYDLNSRFSGRFSSDVVCLPKTYLLGFEKCGSTFLWCFISKVISAYSGNSGKSSDQFHADKEPYFWTPFQYTKSLPNASTIGNPYMLNFMRSVAPEVTSEERKNIMLIDGTPGTVIEWPKFREEESDLANYCLLPSTLPQLFPNSKYVVIMRDPVNMLYSNFWWSYYFGAGINWSYINDLFHTRKGPEIFHVNSVNKINSFLDCLRDESEAPCPFFDANEEDYSECVLSRKHLHSKCVYEITHERRRQESAVHRGIYYVHVQKWLSILPPDRILFTTLEKLTKEPSKVAAQVLDFFEIIGEDNNLPLTDKMVNNITSGCSTNPSGVIDYKNMPETKYPPKETEIILRKFFAPFNRLLANLLNSTQFLWDT